MSFVHLHTHSHYSLLDGLAKIDGLVAKAKEFKMPALALTDHGVMYGAIEFYQKATKAGIKPILGIEAYVARYGLKNKRPKIDDHPYHLVLLAKNEIGYYNLIKLTSIAHLEGFYYKPRIDWELLKKYSEGLIGLSACLQGEVARCLLNQDENAAKEAIQRYRDIFGSDNFYLEVQHHPSLGHQDLVNEKIFELAKIMKMPVVATVDVHYLEPSDDYAQDVLLCIQTKKTLSDTDRLSYLGEDFSFRSPEQMKADFYEHPEVIGNSLKIAEQCNLKLEFGKPLLPNFSVPNNKNSDDYLKDLCLDGLTGRYGFKSLKAAPKEIKERLEYELSVITQTGFTPYFLIVADFINWAKDNKIVVGPGRGSAAGSLVAYLINIIDIDPLKYDLIFERFLNPERVSMPDIDTDFADTRRDEVIDYVSQKYGHNQVAQIITFGTMAARAAIRDVGRVMGMPYTYCDSVAKMIPMFMSLDEATKKVPELQEVMTAPDGRRLMEIAKKLEGCARHVSTHACGIVIAPDDMDKYVPRQYASQDDKTIVTQYEMHAIDDLGLLKMDFLGLKNLTIIENTLEILKKGRNIDFKIENIPLDDKITFTLLKKVETVGVFQLESSGMRRCLKQLKPTELEDIIAIVALFRPGPMEFIPEYIAGKHGQRKIEYLDSRLEPILAKTYGIAVYQEQLMEIAKKLAGFSYSEADVLRKAVGKKIPSLLKEQEEKVISGMVKNNIKPAVAKKIWEFILPFARYGFNRSHAACYALIAYQTAYLKAHYPTEFMASLLTADHGNMDRIAIEVEECRKTGLEVLPPDINESYSTFTVVYGPDEKESKKIRFGLTAIKNLGENIVKAVITERKQNGHFKSLEDLLSRVKTKDLNKKSLEALIKSGALDKLGERSELLYNIDKLLVFIKNVNSEIEGRQSSLFGLMATEAALPKLNFDPIEPATEKQKLSWEKEFLGLYVSAHPLSEFTPEIKDKVVTIASLLSNNQDYKKQAVKVAGIITAVKKIFTRTGEPMLFVKIEDQTSGIEVLVFPSILRLDPALWQEDRVIMLSCRLSDKEGETKLICNQAKELTPENVSTVVTELEKLDNANHYLAESFRKPLNPKKEFLISGNVYMVLSSVPDSTLSQKLKEIFKKYPGRYKVYLLLKNQQGFKKVVTNFLISEAAKAEVEALLGQGSFRVEKYN